MKKTYESPELEVVLLEDVQLPLFSYLVQTIATR